MTIFRYKFCVFAIFGFLNLLINTQISNAKNLRPLNSERPTKSDSVYTLNKLKLQLETSIFSKTFDKNSKNKSSLNLNSYLENLTIRIGITPNTELQYISDGISFYKIRKNDSSYKNKNGSNGEKFIRIKQNILGNDEGKVGIAVIAFSKIDNAQDKNLKTDLRAGALVPFNYKIDNKYTFGGMLKINYYKNSNNIKTNNYIGFANAYYISRSFSNKLNSFIEIYSLRTYKYNKFIKNYLDFGVEYLLSDSVKIDFGTNFGLSKSANNTNYFTGITWRY